MYQVAQMGAESSQPSRHGYGQCGFGCVSGPQQSNIVGEGCCSIATQLVFPRYGKFQLCAGTQSEPSQGFAGVFDGECGDLAARRVWCEENG